MNHIKKFVFLGIVFSYLCLIGMQYQTPQGRMLEESAQDRRKRFEQWLKAVEIGDFANVEKGINNGINALNAIDSYNLHNLKRNGYYAKKRGEMDNKYYQTLRVLKKNGVDIGMPYSEFGDPELDAPYSL